MIPSPEELTKEALKAIDTGSYGEKGRQREPGTIGREREKMKRRSAVMENMGLIPKGKKKGSGSGLALAGLAGGAALTGLYLLHKKKKENEAALQAQRAAAQRAAMAGQMKMAEHTGPTSLIKMAAENLSQVAADDLSKKAGVTKIIRRLTRPLTSTPTPRAMQKVTGARMLTAKPVMAQPVMAPVRMSPIRLTAKPAPVRMEKPKMPLTLAQARKLRDA